MRDVIGVCGLLPVSWGFTDPLFVFRVVRRFEVGLDFEFIFENWGCGGLGSACEGPTGSFLRNEIRAWIHSLVPRIVDRVTAAR
jgi:hypothetical protein